MCETICGVDWSITADMLTGVGTFLFGLAAAFTLLIQYGFRRKARDLQLKNKKLETELKNMFISYIDYMASSEGIVWEDYSGSDDKMIITPIAEKSGLSEDRVKELLDQLKAAGKI